MSSEDSECSDLGSGLGSNLGSDLGSDELMDVDSLEVPCVLCPTSPLPAYDASLHGSVVVRRIQVDELIYGGRHRCSEVYAGRILQAEGLSSDDGPEPSVVVKLVDPSRFKFDDDGDACYYWTSEAAAQRVCTVEVASYAALVGVPVVPKWFGSYCVCLVPPCSKDHSDPLEVSSWKKAGGCSAMYWNGSKARPSNGSQT